MMPMRFSTLSALAVIGLLPLAARAQFDDPKPSTSDAASGSASSEIRDTAGIFSRDAVREALARLVTIERTHRVPTTIETIESLRGEALDEATLRYAKRLGPQAKGIYILISKADHKLEARASRDLTAFSDRSKLKAIQDAFIIEFKNGDEDAGLRRAVDTIEKTLAASKGDDSASRPSTRRTTTAEAGTSTAVKRGLARLTLTGARQVIAAAEAKSAEAGYKMNIAVVDDGGHLLAFARMDDARPASVATATTKAITAATYRQATGPLAGNGSPSSPDILLNISLQNAAAVSGGKITTLLGGVPIIVDGQVIGAIGVGGGSGEQDAEVANAAVKKFLADLGGSATPAK
jgi:glc operon protein GlcG